jgi:membrane associated rhomboid family serine protease
MAVSETGYEEAVCFQCGVLGPDAPEMCGTCGGAIYHLGRPSELRTAEYAIKARRERRGGMAFIYAMIPGGLVTVALTYITGVYLLDATVILVLSLPFYPIVARFMKSRLPPGILYLEDNLEGIQQRFWLRLATGAPIVGALALGIVHFAVDDLSTWWAIPERLLHGDELRTIFTSAVVHGNLPHLIANVFGLLLFGVAVDLRVGRAMTLVLMAAAAVGACYAHAGFTAEPWIPMVGASGMVYGLIGAELALMPTRRMVITPMGIAMELPNFVWIILLVGLYAVFDAYSSPHIAWIAHVGGFAVGVVVGLAMRALPTPERFAEFEAWREERLERVKRDSG